MQKTVSYYLTILYKDFFAHTSEKLQEINLNYGSVPFIIYVGKHPQCTPAELTKNLHADWGHSQRMLNRLVKDGFLTKEKNPETDRTYHLNLTVNGELAFKICHDVFYSWDNKILKNFTEDEKTLLLEILEKLMLEVRHTPDMQD